MNFLNTQMIFYLDSASNMRRNFAAAVLQKLTFQCKLEKQSLTKEGHREPLEDSSFQLH